MIEKCVFIYLFFIPLTEKGPSASGIHSENSPNLGLSRQDMKAIELAGTSYREPQSIQVEGNCIAYPNLE